MHDVDLFLPKFDRDDKKRWRIWRESFSGLLLHEVGHIVAASAHGKILSEFILLKRGSTSSAYFDEAHRSRLQHDQTLRLKMIAGGLSAEQLVTGDFSYSRADQDIAELYDVLRQRMPRSETQIKAEMQKYVSVSDEHLPMLKSAYELTAAAVVSKRFIIDGWHVVPYRVFGPAIKVSLLSDLIMRWRTRKPERAHRTLQRYFYRLQPDGVLRVGSGV